MSELRTWTSADDAIRYLRGGLDSAPDEYGPLERCANVISAELAALREKVRTLESLLESSND